MCELPFAAPVRDRVASREFPGRTRHPCLPDM